MKGRSLLDAEVALSSNVVPRAVIPADWGDAIGFAELELDKLRGCRCGKWTFERGKAMR
jgi:hypothetical protein